MKMLTVIATEIHQSTSKGKRWTKSGNYYKLIRPVSEEILEEYVEFESKINAKKQKELDSEREKVLKEHKRQIVNAKKRLKEHEEKVAAHEKKKKAEKAAADIKESEILKDEL